MTVPGPDRGQANVVGVAVLVGLTMLGVAAVIAGVGTVVDSAASEASTAAVAGDLDALLESAVRHHRGSSTIQLHGGRLEPTTRQVQVTHDGDPVVERAIGGLRYRGPDGRGVVTVLNGAIVRSDGRRRQVKQPPRVTVTDRSTGSLMIGIVDLQWHGPSTAARNGALAVETTRDVRRHRAAPASLQVSVETAMPVQWEEWFRNHGATVSRSDTDADGITTVQASFGNRSLYVVVYEVELIADG